MILQKIKNKFFEFLENHDRKRIIMDRADRQPLLTRYYIFLKDRKWFPFNVFIHKFHKGDPGDPHDHPWPYATLILKGGYWEWTPVFNSEGKMIGEKAQWCRLRGTATGRSGPDSHRSGSAALRLRPLPTCCRYAPPDRPAAS